MSIKILTAMPRNVRNTLMALTAATTLTAASAHAQQNSVYVPAQEVTSKSKVGDAAGVLQNIEIALSDRNISMTELKNSIHAITPDNIKEVADGCKSKLCSYEGTEHFKSVSAGEVLMIFICENTKTKQLRIESDAKDHLINCLKLRAIVNGTIKKQEILNAFIEYSKASEATTHNLRTQRTVAYGKVFDAVFGLND